MLGSGLLVVHDSLVSGEDGESELSGRKHLWDDGLELRERDVESRRDYSALVESSVEIDDDLSGSLVINDFEVTNVSVLLHNSKEFDDNLG